MVYSVTVQSGPERDRRKSKGALSPDIGGNAAGKYGCGRQNWVAKLFA